MSSNPRMHTGILIKSPYAYGDWSWFPYAYGDFIDPRMHTGIMCHAIPVCIRGSIKSPYTYGDQDQSPYAYGDYMTCDPRSLYAYARSIPVCKQGSHVMQSLYAYGDYIMWSPYAYGDQEQSPYAYRDNENPRMHMGVKINPHMHTGIACHVIPVWIRGFICVIGHGILAGKYLAEYRDSLK